MMHEYKTITRQGIYYGDLARTMRRYDINVTHKRMSDGGDVGAIIYLESDGLVVIAMLKSPGMEGSLDNTLLAVSSHSQERNIVIADDFERKTGLSFRQAEPDFCDRVQSLMDIWIRKSLESGDAIKYLKEMFFPRGQVPFLN